jgi:hypothetical protein
MGRKAKELTQQEINELYKQKFITKYQASKLHGTSRQYIQYMIDHPKKKGDRFKTTLHENKYYIETKSFRSYLIEYKSTLLKKLNGIKLPTEF